jgi:hypothetical protein
MALSDSKFYIQFSEHNAYFFIIKPTRCANFTNLFSHKTLNVSGSSSAYHRDFIHSTLRNDICHTGLKTAFEQDHDGTHGQNKFVKLVHLVGFIVKKFVTMHGHMN